MRTFGFDINCNFSLTDNHAIYKFVHKTQVDYRYKLKPQRSQYISYWKGGV